MNPRTRWKHRKYRSEINVTPLVDVVLVLLIVFLVVTPMLQRGKPVELPEASQVSTPDRGGDPIVVSITRDGRVWLDKREVGMEELAGALGRAVASAPGTPVVLKGDRSLSYRTVREVILQVSKTRLPGISLATVQAKDGEAK